METPEDLRTAATSFETDAVGVPICSNQPAALHVKTHPGEATAGSILTGIKQKSATHTRGVFSLA